MYLTRKESKHRKQALGNTVWPSLTVTSVCMYFPPIPQLGMYPREASTYVHTQIHTWIFTAALFMITNSWKQLYVLKEWTDQEAVVHPPNEILSNKEGTHGTEGSQRHDTQWEKAVSEGYLCILSDPIYITSFKGQNYGDRVEINGWHGLRVAGGYDYRDSMREFLRSWYRSAFWLWWWFHKHGWFIHPWTDICAKTHWTVCFFKQSSLRYAKNKIILMRLLEIKSTFY